MVDTNEETIANGSANGYCFGDFSVGALAEALNRAVGAYRSYPDVWKQLVTTGMRQDWSWNASAKRYSRLYEQTVANKQIHQEAVN